MRRNAMQPIRQIVTVLALAFSLSNPAFAAEANNSDLESALSKEILPRGTPLEEVQRFCESRISGVPRPATREEWERAASAMRRDVLERVIFRGCPKAWRDAPANVEWLETIDGGPGYSIRKLRFEAVPGMWVPALLYVPEKLERRRVAVALNFNGHVGAVGKAIDYKQVICINQAKRGMLALNVEWLGMGQLSDADNGHNRLNQLDLCGVSGIAPFYLHMTRALDVLLAHENADPTRVAVTGLSGGGWQTIVLSALDTRVTLSAPVAGYSSFRTRARHLGDLGDSEQTPSDLAAVAEYAHLTALLAPRPALLTYNLKDECCFASDHALAPLVDAAKHAYELYGKPDALRTHVNAEPGTHNYEKDNREAFYSMLGDHFFAGDAKFPREEIPCEAGEIKTQKDLDVELRPGNATLHSLAVEMMRGLPRERVSAEQLRDVVQFRNYALTPEQVPSNDDTVRHWRLNVGPGWTVPAVEVVRRAAKPAKTVIVINDKGRRASAKVVDELLKDGHRVVAVDLFGFGESAPPTHGYLLALLVAATGERPLGVQASQLAAVARWLHDGHAGQPVTVRAIGPRSSTIAVVASALEPKAVAGVRVEGALRSLKELIERNRSVEEMPELFCFGLLEWFDVSDIAALSAPRPVEGLDDK